MTGTALRGTLDDIPGFHLFRQLYLTRETGNFAVRNGTVCKSVVFRKGSIVFAVSNCESERLGILLAQSGVLAQRQVDTALAQCANGKRFGQSLVEMGMLSAADVDRWVRKLQSEIAVSVLAMDSGSFEFVRTSSSPYEDVFIDHSTADIIFEGVRRIESCDRVRELLGSPEQQLTLAAEPLLRFQHITLDTSEAYVLSRIEGAPTISEICRISAVDEALTLRSLLGFVLTGVAEAADKPPAGPRPDFASRAAAAESAQAQPDPALRAEILERSARLDSSNLYETLGCRPEAGLEELTQSYYQLAKRLHPDLYGRTADAVLRAKGEAVFTAVAGAFKILADPLLRRQYDRRLRETAAAGSDEPAPAAAPQSLRLVARNAFDDGMRLFKAGDYADALGKFREATGIDHDMAPYRFQLAQTLARFPHRLREAEFHFQLTIHQAPWNPEYLIALGRFYQAAGLAGRAETCFRKARDLQRARPQSHPPVPPPAHGRPRGILARFLHH